MHFAIVEQMFSKIETFDYAIDKISAVQYKPVVDWLAHMQRHATTKEK